MFTDNRLSINELIRNDPDIREKIENGCLNRITVEKTNTENKYEKGILKCGTRMGKGVSMVFPENIK